MPTLTECNKQPDSYTFKARPINKAVMESAGDLGVPRIQKKDATKPREFKLSSGRPRSAKPEEAAEKPLYSSFGAGHPAPKPTSRPNSARGQKSSAPCDRLSAPPARWSAPVEDVVDDRPLYSSFGGVPPVPKRPVSARKPPTAAAKPVTAAATVNPGAAPLVPLPEPAPVAPSVEATPHELSEAVQEVDSEVTGEAACEAACETTVEVTAVEAETTLDDAAPCPVEAAPDEAVEAAAELVPVATPAAASSPAAFSAVALQAALRALRAEAPGQSLSNKAAVTKLKERHPEWPMGAKEVREAQRALDAEPPAAATPDVLIKADAALTPPTHEL